MGVGARRRSEPVLSRCGLREPLPLAKGAGSEGTPVEEVKPERVWSEDRERGGPQRKKTRALNSEECLLGLSGMEGELPPTPLFPGLSAEECGVLPL